MRAFIAVELPVDIQEVLGSTSEGLGAGLSSRAVRWVRPGNIHLTLRFLGDTDEEMVNHIGQAIDRAVENFPIFSLELEKLGCFASPRNPRIIWVGIGGETERLFHLYTAIEQVVANFGWEPEGRRFHPHLTIGRVKDRRSVIEANLAYGRIVEAKPFSVTSVSLIESILKPEGADYTCKYRCHFGEN